MKIKVEADGYRFTIPLPFGIIANGFTAGVIKRIIENHLRKYVNVPFTGEQISVLLKELKQVKKMFPHLVLVDVKTADAQRVLITL